MAGVLDVLSAESESFCIDELTNEFSAGVRPATSCAMTSVIPSVVR